MAIQSARIQSMVGYKLFREHEDYIEMIRIVHSRKYKDGDPSVIKIRDESTGEVKKVRVDSLKDFTPLEPDGYITFNIVNVRDDDGKVTKDIIVTGSKILNIKIGDKMPYVVCRQCITDVFYNLLCTSENCTIAGLSVNKDNCPTNFDYRLMLACDSIVYNESINFYRTDTLEGIYKMINLPKYDEVLSNLYDAHLKVASNPKAHILNYDEGWCRNLKVLLMLNNFQTDLDEMLGITTVKFYIDDYIKEVPLPGKFNEYYNTLDDDLELWLSITFKINIGTIVVIKYGHDINLADFNNSRYLLIRDKSKTLYLIVYTCAGEYFEKDLEEKAKELDFSSKFRLDFYNKYNFIK